MTATPERATEQSENQFVITRTFDAPRERVFRAWSDAERLAQWWGPKGFALTVSKLDFRPGGIFHYCMKTGAQEMWGRFIYGEIIVPEKIEYISSFSDKDGNLSRAPFFNGGWPLEVLNVVTFTEQDGKTTITLKGGPIHATDAEQATFVGNFNSMQQGFGGTFDQLTNYLASAKE